MSATGHSAVSVVLREENGRSLTPTRVVVQVTSADNAATSCLLFVVEGEPEQAWLEGLSRYKDWGQEDYRKWLGETHGEDGSGLIALLEFSKDKCVIASLLLHVLKCRKVSVSPSPSRQVEVVPDVVRSGQSLVLRMCASGEGVESVAVQAVNVFGHRRTEEERQTMAFLERLVRAAAHSLCYARNTACTHVPYRMLWLHCQPRKRVWLGVWSCAGCWRSCLLCCRTCLSRWSAAG